MYGPDAGPFNRIEGDDIRVCFNISARDDDVKEIDEEFPLRLTSKDEAVCFCRDLALFTILKDPYDGM